MASKERYRNVDLKPEQRSFRDEVIAGLSGKQKRISPKFFYDEEGSKLFNAITRLEEYYPTRTEASILNAHREEICNLFSDHGALFEYGSGGSFKTEILLDSCKRIDTYVPIDISSFYLEQSSKKLLVKYPSLKIISIALDYSGDFTIPMLDLSGNIVAIFLGSSLGNFEPEVSKTFMWNAMENLDEKDRLLVGVDLVKDKDVLERAYNDKSGVTAAFNLNLLKRIRRELRSDINPEDFEHYAFYNDEMNRIEMHLRAKKDIHFSVDQVKITMKKGETIHTENSYKYSVDQFTELARQNHLEIKHMWCDAKNYFAIFVLKKI